MDALTIKQQAEKFKRARGNLMLVVIFTAINLLLALLNTGYYFLFSATAPQFIFEICRLVAQELNNNVFTIIGIFSAFLIIALYFIFFLLSKRIRAFMLAALIFFSIDSLLFVYVFFLGAFDISMILDIVFHGFIMFSLINGVMAWSKLHHISDAEITAAMLPPPPVPVQPYADTLIQGEAVAPPVATPPQPESSSDEIVNP